MAELAVVNIHNASAKERLSLFSLRLRCFSSEGMSAGQCISHSSEQAFAYQRPDMSKHTLYFHLSFSSH